VGLVARRLNRLTELASAIKEGGGRTHVVQADVTDQQQAISAVEEVAEWLGRLDTVVNNAGVMLLGPALGTATDEWDRMIALNVQGLLYVTHAALPHLVEAAGNSPRRVADVVNVSSTAGRVARPGSSVYNLTKFGVMRSTKCSSGRATRPGNAACPGRPRVTSPAGAVRAATGRPGRAGHGRWRAGASAGRSGRAR
jgi:NADP-dependent 3-hydroxy acid dehydrogenase YdfG